MGQGRLVSASPPAHVGASHELPGGWHAGDRVRELGAERDVGTVVGPADFAYETLNIEGIDLKKHGRRFVL
eukprot:3619316-Alexandrium_andersonii.AAC.1